MPNTLSEYAFAGLLRGRKTELIKCLGSDLQVPASAEIVLEGYIDPEETAKEGWRERRFSIVDVSDARQARA